MLEILSEHLYTGRRVVFLCGAGISQASGIPPFRGPSDAIWQESLLEWGTKRKFLQDPPAWYQQFYLRHFRASVLDKQPNAGHEALAELVQRFPSTCQVITQNIDGLHSKLQGTIPDANLIEVHGNVRNFRCFSTKCSFERHKTVKMDEPIDRLEQVPLCPECTGILCPATLLFDELYRDHVLFQFDKALEWLDNADVIAFVGTSFSVGITDIALEAARSRTRRGDFVQLFDFNLVDNEPRTRMSGVKVNFVQGACENSLPQLALLVGSLVEARA